VNEGAVLNIKKLFAINERVITYQEYASKSSSKKEKPKTVATVMVGAFNVGKLALSYTNFKANSWWRKGILSGQLKKEILLNKGDELGTFELGSTVILLLAKGSFTPALAKSGSKVKMGQELGRMS
jgi:phosphatidylserine decarboxylase